MGLFILSRRKRDNNLFLFGTEWSCFLCLLKIRGNFNPSTFYYNGHYYNFDSWDRFAKVDGWICRSDEDCEWIDQYLGCDDRYFKNYRVQGDWPWKNELKGRCTCQNGYLFDPEKGSCNYINGKITNGTLFSFIAVIVVGVVSFMGICFCIKIFCIR